EVVVRVEIVGASFQGGVEVRNRFAYPARSQQRCAESIVGNRVAGANPESLKKVVDGFVELATHLQQRRKIVLGFKILRILLQVMAGHGLLNDRSRIRSR